MRRHVLAVAVTLAAIGTPVGAHHGDADRYNPEVITVTGTVAELQMVIRHVASHHRPCDADDAGVVGGRHRHR